MSRLNCFIPGKEIEGIEEDFRSAQKIEQYRLGKAAIYIPEGFRWNCNQRRTLCPDPGEKTGAGSCHGNRNSPSAAGKGEKHEGRAGRNIIRGVVADTYSQEAARKDKNERSRSVLGLLAMIPK